MLLPAGEKLVLNSNFPKKSLSQISNITLFNCYILFYFFIEVVISGFIPKDRALQLSRTNKVYQKTIVKSSKIINL